MAITIEKLAETIKRVYQVDLSEQDLEALYSGQSLGEVLRITKEQLDQFEGLAYQKLSEKQYQDAYDIFVFLLSLHPEVIRFHVSAGHAMQCMHEFENAMQHYFLAIELNVDYLPAYLGLALSYSMIGDLYEANDTLTSALLIAVDNDDDQGILEINDLYEKINGGKNE